MPYLKDETPADIAEVLRQAEARADDAFRRKTDTSHGWLPATGCPDSVRSRRGAFGSATAGSAS